MKQIIRPPPQTAHHHLPCFQVVRLRTSSKEEAGNRARLCRSVESRDESWSCYCSYSMTDSEISYVKQAAVASVIWLELAVIMKRDLCFWSGCRLFDEDGSS